MKKPHTFCATKKPFVVQLDTPCVVSSYTNDKDRYASFYRPIPVKKGDTFRTVEGGIRLNGKIVHRKARPLRRMIWKVAWVAKRLRVAVFQEQDPIWSKKLKRHTKKLGKPYWTACDVRSYEVGCGDTPVEAVNRLITQCQATELLAAEEQAKGNRVIRWRCLLSPKEVKEMEGNARKTGFILDGVEVPPMPKKWIDGLKKIKRS